MPELIPGAGGTLGQIPGLSMFFGQGGMLGPPVQAPVALHTPIRDINPFLLNRIQAPDTRGLTAAQQAVLGLFGPQATPYAAMTQPGGAYAPVMFPGLVAGGQVGGPIPTVAQAQAGQASPLFGAGGYLGGVYGMGGPLGQPWPMPLPPPGPPPPQVTPLRSAVLPGKTRGPTPAVTGRPPLTVSQTPGYGVPSSPRWMAPTLGR